MQTNNSRTGFQNTQPYHTLWIVQTQQQVSTECAISPCVVVDVDYFYVASVLYIRENLDQRSFLRDFGRAIVVLQQVIVWPTPGQLYFSILQNYKKRLKFKQHVDVANSKCQNTQLIQVTLLHCKYTKPLTTANKKYYLPVSVQAVYSDGHGSRQ